MRTKKAIRQGQQAERELEKATAKYSRQLMSNAKWVRLIQQLVKNVDQVLKVEFKKVQQEQTGELYLDEDTEFGFDYWENGFEEHNSLGGWLTFKEIEYLFFPKIADRNRQTTQDIAAIEALIRCIGEFDLYTDDNGLKLTCYK